MKKSRVFIVGPDAIEWFCKRGHETVADCVKRSAEIGEQCGVPGPTDSKEIFFVFTGLDGGVKITKAFFYGEDEIIPLLADILSQHSLSRNAFKKAIQFDLATEQ